jgi:hypothetical protein
MKFVRRPMPSSAGRSHPDPNIRWLDNEIGVGREHLYVEAIESPPENSLVRY